jgi:conjugative transposon TraJ protein
MDFDQFHQTLRMLYDQMMPLCSNMIGIAKGIAGLGALFYVAYRVWQSLSRAEPIDVYPLLRPFAIGLCIMFFPSVVLGTINSIMSPVVQGTNGMLQSETLDMQKYAELKDRLEYEAMRRNPETAYLVDNDIFEERLDQLGITDVGEVAGMYIERGCIRRRNGYEKPFEKYWKLFLRLRL